MFSPYHTVLRVTISEAVSQNLKKTFGFIPLPPALFCPLKWSHSPGQV